MFCFTSSLIAAGMAQLIVTCAALDYVPTVGYSVASTALLGFCDDVPAAPGSCCCSPIPMPAWVLALGFAVLELTSASPARRAASRTSRIWAAWSADSWCCNGARDLTMNRRTWAISPEPVFPVGRRPCPAEGPASISNADAGAGPGDTGEEPRDQWIGELCCTVPAALQQRVDQAFCS